MEFPCAAGDFRVKTFTCTRAIVAEMKSSFYIDRTFNAIQIFPPCSLLPLPLDILFSSASLRLWAFSPIYLLDLALHIIFVHLQMLFLFGKRAPPSKEHTPIVFTSLPLKFMPQIKSTPVYLKDLSFRYLKIGLFLTLLVSCGQLFSPSSYFLK